MKLLGLIVFILLAIVIILNYFDVLSDLCTIIFTITGLAIIAILMIVDMGVL